MTAAELQRIALRLSNTCWVRHWVHFNHPTQSPWLMAIQARDASGRAMWIDELETRYGFDWDAATGQHYMDRTDEEGEPYRSPL